MPPSDWVPLRWLAAWSRSDVSRLRGTPFNCVIGAPELDGIHTIADLNTAPVHIVGGGKWPRVAPNPGGAGPTGQPWVDSNGYAVRIAQAIDPAKPAWLAYSVPASQALRPAQFALAVCDAAAYGGHWIVCPDDRAWDATVAAARFFEQHKSWCTYHPAARLAVVADFSGPQRALATEVVNLLTRRQVAFKIVREKDATEANLRGMLEVLRIDAHEPASRDPYTIASEAHLKLSRRNDLLRLWNAGSINSFYTLSPDDRRGLLQLINYAAHEPSRLITVGLARAWASARLWMLNAAAATSVEVRRVRDGIELDLPPFAVYAAIELQS